MKQIALIVGLAMALTSCGADDDAENTSTSATKVAFSSISAVIVKGCDGASCHGTGSSNANYVGNETLVQSKAAAIKARVESNSSGLKMPQPSSPQADAFAESDRQALLDYVGNFI